MCESRRRQSTSDEPMAAPPAGAGLPPLCVENKAGRWLSLRSRDPHTLPLKAPPLRLSSLVPAQQGPTA